jgi:protein arginine kinase activator
MLCQKCKKKQASVHMTEIENGVHKEVHLCEDCSRDEGVTMKGQVSLADFLAGLIKAPVAKEVARLADVKCPDCGISYVEFQSKGRFGCARDYDVFRRFVEPLVEKIHGGTEHVGKAPVKSAEAEALRLRLATLRGELKLAVDQEKYELAAQLRDEVQRLEGGSGAAK